MSWNPRTWASPVPLGLGQVKPHHFWEITKTIWENRDSLPYALRILRKGVCDGCALGTSGWRDHTLDGIHLCMIRLNLLRLNTMGPLDPRELTRVDRLRALCGTDLKNLGRLAHPMERRRGEPGFQRIGWDEALEAIAGAIRESSPDRLAFFLTSRGMTNEVYYAGQKAARFLGTNNVDNSARICHSPSTVALKRTLGVSASTCSYQDWIGSDLVVFFGSNVANNQPVTTKYLYYAKQRGTRVVVVNPYREPGMERYWIPSVPESALFGTRLADDFFGVSTGGDVGFLNGVLKCVIENGWANDQFIDRHTTGWAGLVEDLSGQPFEELERLSGASREDMLRLARQLAESETAVFVWSMGLTQHRNGVDNVTALINLALARGYLGRPRCGLMAIRGHSGVQGAAEVGAVPNLYPGGLSVNEANSRAMRELWGFDVPASPGLDAVEMVDAAHRGKLDVLFSSGGNFLDTLPDPDYVQEALERVPLRVHQDIVVNRQMLLEGERVILLPAMTRYEQPGGGTETSTERRILFSPEVRGPRPGEVRPEWEIFTEVAARVRPDEAERIRFENAQAIRDEIARVVPAYSGIETLRRAGDQIQWGGPRLCVDGRCETEDGRARFHPVRLELEPLPPGKFVLGTRRGKQFNSMIHSRHDALTGLERRSVLMSRHDADALGLMENELVILRNEEGELEFRVATGPIAPGNLQVLWPEGNPLIRRGVRDASCGIPEYRAVVEVVRAGRPPN